MWRRFANSRRTRAPRTSGRSASDQRRTRDLQSSAVRMRCRRCREPPLLTVRLSAALRPNQILAKTNQANLFNLRDYTVAMSMVHTDAVFFEDDKAFETWLVDNATTATHVWIRMAKKGTGVTSIDWTRAVDVALCFGWIDGISRRIDDEWYVQRFTPRRAKSVWSKINRARIERLTAEGRMRPSGLAEVEQAKADGRWDAAYDSPATAVVPDDLAAALAARDLTELYAALDGRNRFAFLNRIQTAVRPETRARRIAQLTDALAQGMTPYPAPTKRSAT